MRYLYPGPATRWDYVRAALAVTLFALFLVGVSSLAGCAVQHRPGPNPIPIVGTSIDRARGHLEAAERAVVTAKAHTDKTGKVVLGMASTEHDLVSKELGNALKELAAAQKDRDALVKANGDLAAQASKLEHSWGHRLQVIVTKIVVILAILAGLHFLLGALSVVLPVIFPAAAVAVPILRLVGGIVNPLAWWQFLVDHIHLRRCDNTPCPDSVVRVIPAIPHA